MIFVVGNSRSGTTMLGRVLGQHPDIFTLGELHYFEQLWEVDLGRQKLERIEAVRLASELLSIQRDGYYAKRDREAYTEDAERLLNGADSPLDGASVYQAVIAAEARRAGKVMACDQTPRNLYYLDELLTLYPEARVAVIVRDPRDVLLSQKRRWKRRRLGAGTTPRMNALRTWAGYHPVTISMLWRSGVMSGDRLAAHDRVSIVHFEDLVADPATEIKKLCVELELDFDASMLEVPRVGSSAEADRPGTTGLDSSAAGRWRRGGLRTAEIAECERIAGESMLRHGYELSGSEISAVRRVASILAMISKGGLAFALNLGRTKNLVGSLRRRFTKRPDPVDASEVIAPTTRGVP